MEQTAELWLKIDQYHLNYLKAEEGVKKLEIRKKLEGQDIFFFAFFPIMGDLGKKINGVLKHDARKKWKKVVTNGRHFFVSKLDYRGIFNDFSLFTREGVLV